MLYDIIPNIDIPKTYVYVHVQQHVDIHIQYAWSRTNHVIIRADKFGPFLMLGFLTFTALLFFLSWTFHCKMSVFCRRRKTISYPGTIISRPTIITHFHLTHPTTGLL